MAALTHAAEIMSKVTEAFAKDTPTGQAEIRKLVETALKERDAEHHRAADKQLTLQEAQDKTKDLEERLRQPRRTPLSKQRNTELVPTLEHKDGFVQFSKKLISFCQDEPGLAKILKEVSKIDPEIDIDLDQLDRDNAGVPVKDVNRELHTLLSGKTTGQAWGIVEMHDENGLAAWRALHTEYRIMTQKGRRKLLKAFLFPSKASKNEEIPLLQTKWELTLQRYLEAGGDKPAEDVCVAAYEAILKDEMNKRIDALPEDLKTVNATQAYVRKQLDKQDEGLDNIGLLGKGSLNHVDSGKEEAAEASKGPENDMMNMIQELYSLVKGKGKGKGGKGACSHCGSPDHFLRQCKEFDKVMEARRAEKGGKNGGGKGWGKDHQGGGKGMGGKSYEKGNGKGNGKGYDGGWQNYGGWQRKGNSKGAQGKGVYGFDEMLDCDQGGGNGHQDGYWHWEGAAFILEETPSRHTHQNQFEVLAGTEDDEQKTELVNSQAFPTIQESKDIDNSKAKSMARWTKEIKTEKRARKEKAEEGKCVEENVSVEEIEVITREIGKEHERYEVHTLSPPHIHENNRQRRTGRHRGARDNVVSVKFGCAQSECKCDGEHGTKRDEVDDNGEQSEYSTCGNSAR